MSNQESKIQSPKVSSIQTFHAGDSEYICCRPTQAQMMQGQQIAAIMFNNCLKNGIMTRAEMEKIAKERGIFDGVMLEKEKSLEEEREKTQEVFFNPNVSSKERDEAGEALKRIVQEMALVNQSKESFFQQTCESIAQNAYMYYLLAQCTKHKTSGLPVWSDPEDSKEPSYDVIMASDDEDVLVEAYKCLLCMINGLSMDLLEPDGTSKIIDGLKDTVSIAQRIDAEEDETSAQTTIIGGEVGENWFDIQEDSSHPDTKVKPKRSRRTKKATQPSDSNVNAPE